MPEKLVVFANDIKLHHTVFALPFALLSTFLAAPILGIATHPMTLRFPFDTLRMFETLRAGGFTDQQARTLTYVILDLVAGTPP